MAITFIINGPPGTGKTTTLQRLVSQAADTYGEDNIMLCAFTRAAAAVLRQRVTTIEAVGTLHSFCFEALLKPDIAEGHTQEFNAKHPNFALEQKKKGSLDEPGHELMSQMGAGDQLFSEYQILRAKMIGREKWPTNVLKFAEIWSHWKHENGFLDFTDLIEECLLSIDYAPGMPSSIFVDEAQDLTELEISLLKKWSDGAEEITFSGDWDQCIYAFKGAMPESFMNIPNAIKKVLGQSYRVPKAIRELAMKNIRKCSKREDVTYKPTPEEGSVKKFPYTYNCDFTKELHGCETMILTSCSYMLEPIIRKLRAQCIPFHNPYRRVRGDWNPLNRDRRGSVTTVDTIISMLEFVPEFNRENLDRFLKLQKNLSRKVFEKGFNKQVDMLNEKWDMGTFQFTWHNFLSEEVRERIRSNDLSWLIDNLVASKRKVYDFPVKVINKWGLKALSEPPKVIVGTFHSVKGGEAQRVIMFPDLSKAGAKEYGSGNKDSIIRTFYVGMTRAKEALLIGQPASNLFYQV